MANESRLSITIDSRDAEQKAKDLRTALDAMDAAGIRVSSSATKAGQSSRAAGAEFAATGGAARQGAGDVDRLSKSFNESGDRAATAAATINRTLRAAFAGFSAMKVIDIADQWGQYASRLKMATQSTEEYNQVQNRMVVSAQTTFRSINETKEAFIQMSPILRGMGLSLGQSMDAIDAFSGLLVVNAASGERAQSAMDALSRSFQTGRVSSESWQTILAAIPSVVDTIAQSTGKSANEIRAMGIAGELSAKMLADALVNGYRPIIKAVEGMPTTVRDAFTNLNSSFSEYIGRTNEASGVTQVLVDGINALSENFDTIAEVVGVGVAGAIALYTSRTIGATAATIQNMAAQARKAQSVIADAEAEVARAAAVVASTRANLASTATLAELTAAENAHAAAVTRATTVRAASAGVFRGLLGLLGGPVGIIATLGIAAVSMLSFGNNAHAATAGVDALKGSVDLLTGSLNSLTKAGLGSASALIEGRIEESARLAVDAKSKIDALQNSLKDTAPGSEAAKAIIGQISSWGAVYGEANKNISALKARLEEIKKTIGERDALANGATGTKLTDPQSEKRLQAMRDELALSELTGEARARLQAQQSLGVNATAEEIKAAGDLGAQIYRNNEARKEATKTTADGVKAMNSMLSSLKEHAATLGMTSAEEQLYKIRVSEGTKAQKEQAAALVQTIAAFDQAQRQAEAFQKIMDDLYPDRAAGEEFITQVAVLSQALDNGSISASDFADAMERLAKKSNKSMDSMSQFAVQAARNIQDSIGDGLYDILSGNFDNIAKSWGDMIMRMVAQAAAAQLARALFGDFGNTGSIGGIAGSLISSVGGWLGGSSLPSTASWALPVMPSAKGNVFGPGSDLDYYRNSIVSSPTLFRFAKGGAFGMMGEAGSEAIMPLKRGPDGRLGVSADASAPPNFAINIINQGEPMSATQQGSPRFDGEQWVIDVVVNRLRRNSRTRNEIQGLLR